MRESQAEWNGCRPISTASTTANHYRSSIGRRPATITFGIFRLIPTDENGLIAKVGQSIPNLILCGLSTNGVTHSLRTRSRFNWKPIRRGEPFFCRPIVPLSQDGSFALIRFHSSLEF